MKILALFISLSISGMLLCGCASDMFLEKRDAKLGPYATTYWRDKDTRQKSAREVEEFDEQLQLKVDKYIAIHPELPEEVKKWMSYLHVVVGMNKEQVLMLLGTPYKKNKLQNVEQMKYGFIDTLQCLCVMKAISILKAIL